MQFNALQHKYHANFNSFLTHYTNIKGKPPILLAPILRNFV
jgi:hypothetical protein